MSQRYYIVSLCYFLLFCGAGLFAQEKRLEGKITNTQDVEGIHILNLSSRYNSITDQVGAFFITVKPLDTLVISSISYQVKELVVSPDVYDRGFVTVTLDPMVNQLDEVYLGPNLSGDIARDIQRIKVEDPINFDDVGIPGYKGKAQERKVPLAVALIPTKVDIEAIYKHLSGYYRKLKLQREWEAQNQVVAHIIHYYEPSFFTEVYGLPQDRVYDFLLFCVDTTPLTDYYRDQRLSLVMKIFQEKAPLYISRISQLDAE